ncbi:metallophosphoesterase [Mycobacteroides abscessus]|nr:metallophosphoesterase [Mycobacteroides abscessus]
MSRWWPTRIRGRDAEGGAKPLLRALVISDTNPRLPAGIAAFVRDNDVQLVITGGDLGADDLRGIEDLSVPAVGVYGNHCRRGYFADLGIIDLHVNQVSVNGFSFTGLEGCVRYKDGCSDILYSQDEYRELVKSLPAADVIVSHCPPAGINDHPEHQPHVGVEALRDHIAARPPKLLIHGHTYPKDPVTQWGPTRVAYVYRAAVIDIAADLSITQASANAGEFTL